MLERTYRQYDLKPYVYPYSSHKWVNDLIASSSDSNQRGKKTKTKHKKDQKFPHITSVKDHGDKNRYPSSCWQTENQTRYKIIDFSKSPRDRQPFVVTTIDSRKHNPQSKQIFHIRRINNKPVCKVHTWIDDHTDMNKDKGNTIYMTSFPRYSAKGPRELVKSIDKETVAEGIVPFDQPAETCNVREEMLLPMCETTRIPSAPHPHKYLLRKKKVPPSVGPSGVFYDADSGETLPRIPVKDLRLHRESSLSPERNCISSLQGHEFTRKRYIPPPPCSFPVGSFDGGVSPIESNKFNDRYIPFVRVRTII